MSPLQFLCPPPAGGPASSTPRGVDVEQGIEAPLRGAEPGARSSPSAAWTAAGPPGKGDIKLWALLALALTGCAFGPGTGFATVAGSTVSVTLPMGPGRMDDAGRWKTSNGYLVTPALAVTLQSVALQAPGATSAGGTFDPANPPAGYSLCHGGHCHRADGALIDYAEIQAAMASGGASAPTRVLEATAAQPTVPVGLNQTTSWLLAGCAPDCFLDRGRITGAALQLERLTASGTVEAGGATATLPQGVRRFTLDLPLAGQPFSAAVSASVDRGQPGTYRLGGALELTDKLFDGIEWPRLAQSDGELDLDADAASRETLLANLAKSAWTASFTPQP